MENQNSIQTQTADDIAPSAPQSAPSKAAPEYRREPPDFPLYYIETSEGLRMMGPKKLAVYEASLKAKANAQEEARAAVRAAREAELAAGRPTTDELVRQPSGEAVKSFASFASLPSPDFSRHARRCCICSHPDRDAIEGDFVRWRSPEEIAKDYDIPDRVSIYRHAHATGLFAWRKRELGRVLEGVIDASECIPLESADVIIRAVRVYAHLDEEGKWFEPPRTNFFFTAPAAAISGLGSELPTNSGRAGKRTARVTRRKGEEKANRNIRPFRKSVNSLNAKEKANS
jgi:hypothetical protein